MIEGKTKKLHGSWAPGNKKPALLEFSDRITAGNKERSSEFILKGQYCNGISGMLMQRLNLLGICTHFSYWDPEKANAQWVTPLEMYPIEVVVRNWAAGSFCKRYNKPPGILHKPIVEYFIKNDDMGDPQIPVNHISFLEPLLNVEQLEYTSLRINGILLGIFGMINLRLVDIKLEFGMKDCKLTLGDEISPDTMRLWEMEGCKCYDKDIFRKDGSNPVVQYQYVYDLLRTCMVR